MRQALRRFSIAAALLGVLGAAGTPPARADDPGARRVPSDGEDVVRLDDGRTLRCRVAGRDAATVRLEFPAGAVEVPKDRVARVLLFRDFDPAPRDAAEREKAERGLVRWAGDWYSPVRAKELRAAFLAAEAKAVADSRPAPDWERRNVVRSPPFVVESDLPAVRTREYADLLQKYLECLKGHLQLSIASATANASIPVHIHRDFRGFQEEAARDGGVGEHTVGYFQFGRPGTEHLVLFDMAGNEDETLDVLLHEATHMFLHFASGRGSTRADLWLNEGLAEYMGGSTWKWGKFQPGALQEERLLWFQEMLEEGRSLPLDGLVNPRMVDGGEFGLDHYAQSWCFVHFLLHGRQGAYRGAFRDYLKEGKFLEGAGYLLHRLERKDFQKIQKEFEDYARGLRLTGGRAFARRALIRAREGKDSGAAQDLEKAVARAGQDGPTFRAAARAARALDRDREAAGLYLRAVEGDPLDAGLRLERAACLEGVEALREARFAASLAPEDGKVLGDAARVLYRLAKDRDASLPPRDELTREAGDLASGAAAGGEGTADPSLAARAAIEAGDLARARSLVRSGKGPRTAEGFGLAAAVEGLDGKPAEMAAVLAGFRALVRRRAGTPSEGAAIRDLAEAVSLAVTLCLEGEKAAEAAAALEALYGKEAPGTEIEWVIWASAAGMAAGAERSAEVLDAALRAFPGSIALLRMRKTLEMSEGDEEEATEDE